ncbi:MAG: N-methyl-L-tryptophan oxidase, partial [Chloroflexota bacterium]
MTDSDYDVIVVGLGIMGAGALYQAAKRGAKVLGIDRHTPPHNMGSSHGDTRITRQAIGEGEAYMPFIRRTNEIWRELEAATGNKLYYTTGGVSIAPRDGGAQFHNAGDFVERTAEIATAYGIAHEVIDADETMRRYPLLKLGAHERTYVEPGAGVLHCELCVQSQLDEALRHGATVRTGEMVLRYSDTGDSVRVETDRGSYCADRLVLAAGPWMLDFLPLEVRPRVEVYRQVIYWFEAEDIEPFTEENFPFLIWIGDRKDQYFSDFPALRDGIQGVKVLTESYIEAIHPNDIDRTVHQHEIDHIYHEITQPRLHGVTDKLLHADVCMYTVTPDNHFIIDFHPESERMVIASPCSGHGFKHSAAVGEALAELALDGVATLNTDAFKLSRLLTKER